MTTIRNNSKRRTIRRKKYRNRRIFWTLLFLLLICFLISGIFDSLPSQQRAEVSEVDGIPLITDYISPNTMARPGEKRKIMYVVIHETGNSGSNANADSHNEFLHANADLQSTSWHYTVDDSCIYSHIPDNEIAFHAGDNLKQKGGNANGIGIEMCINPENDYEQTLKNTAKLAAFLLDAYHLNTDALKKHQDFSGKHCPDRLLTADRWEEFVEMVKAER